jgi:gamma-glutamylaminecyclotransferase
MKHRLFVYGTLLAGEANAHMLAGARRIGPAATTATYDLLDCSHLADYGRFPGLRAGGRTSVKGQLYLLDDGQLAVLDQFEGHPDLFTRTDVALSGGGRAQAYMVADGQFAGAPLIPNGDWRRHRQRQVALRLAGSHAGP